MLVHALGVLAGQGPRTAVADNIGGSVGHQEFGDGIARSTDAGQDDAYILDLLPDDLQGIDEGRKSDDRGAVLVIVEDRDVELLAQACLDVEALGRSDVLQVDAPVGRGDRLDDRDDLLRVLRIQGDRPGIDVAELLEEHGLALHDRHGGRGTDVAHAQNRGAIGDNGDRVLLDSELAGTLGVVIDRLAHAGNTRGVHTGQVAPVVDGVLRSR